MADNQQRIREEALKTASIVKDALDQISGDISDIFEKALGNVEGIASKTLKTVKRELTNFADVSRNISDINTKASEGLLKQKDLTREINKRKSQMFGLDTQINILKNNTLKLDEKEVKLLEELEGKRKELNTYNEEYTKELEKQLKYSNNINKSVNATGIGLNVLSKLSSKVGLRGLDDAFDKAKKASIEKAKKLGVDENKSLGIGDKFKTAGSAMGSLASSFGDFLKGPIWITALMKVAEFFWDAMNAASKQVAEFQRNLGVSRDNAVEIRDRFFEISDSAKALANTQAGNLLLQKDLVEAQDSFNTALGLSVDLSTSQNEEFAAQFTNIKKFYNLNDQEQKGLVNLNATNNKTLDETKNSILGQTALYRINTKEAINIRKVFKEVLTTSNATKLSIKGGSDALVQSVINAQRLGVKLDDLGKISDSLLNFEESISSELEAELILGRDLELEKARAAALMNDQVTLTEEVNRLVRESGPDFEKNRIAMQATAKAIGISVEDLADMVTQQKVLEKFKQNFQALDKEAIKNSKALEEGEKERLLSGKATAEDYYKFAKEQGEDLVKILGKEQAIRMEAQDAQQKFNDALEKAKETFSRFVDGGSLDAFADFLVKFVESVNSQGLWTTLFTGLDDDVDIAEAKIEKKQEEISIESDPEKKKQLQDDLAKLQIEKDKIEYETEKKRLLKGRESLINQGYNTGQADLELARLEQKYPTQAKEAAARNTTIRTPGENNATGTGAAASNQMNEMIKLQTQQNQYLAQQNTLLTNMNNKSTNIVMDGTKLGTTMRTSSPKTQ
ncbi:hypothetical protein UFOVP331_18 [uncultured Caudovirales phage]|uniref:Uncharacterized protein n=1 Tax=uncultured Caudovirales phage TaxID=2100421 RepID=A0A6J5M028_9CAUD|nr:hypothetical protein UFOVP331_18 [uncultured Caudovirales phage]